MQFTTEYRQMTKNRRRCMICSKLIRDGEVAFFKGERGQQGKAVHDACRADTGGGWYARDCAVSYVQGRLGHWTLVTDYALEELQWQERRLADYALQRNSWREGGMPEDMLAMADAAFAAREPERQAIIAFCKSSEFTVKKLAALKSAHREARSA